MSESHLPPIQNCGAKLKHLRSKLRRWNWEVFVDLKHKMRYNLAHLHYLEGQSQHHDQPDPFKEILKCKTEYFDLHVARLMWLKDGDQNSKFYHAYIKPRIAANKMNLELEDGTFLDNRDIIGNQALNFFKDLFTGTCPPG